MSNFLLLIDPPAKNRRGYRLLVEKSEMPVAYFSADAGAITPIRAWLQYAGQTLAPIRRSQSGSYMPVADIRRFVGIDLARESAPDATTLLKFRRLLETRNLTKTIFATINAHLAQKGRLLREGSVVDATIIAAPPSVKNKKEERGPEMHQTKKGNQWHFGMKVHIGADADSGVVHTLVGSAANVNDVTQAHALLHGEETTVHADAGYTGVEKREENQGKSVLWQVAMKPGKRRILPDSPLGRLRNAIEKAKASIRAKVEHPFHIVKNLFKHRKTRYRGLEKNTVQMYSLFGFANLLIVKRRLMALNGAIAS